MTFKKCREPDSIDQLGSLRRPHLQEIGTHGSDGCVPGRLDPQEETPLLGISSTELLGLGRTALTVHLGDPPGLRGRSSLVAQLSPQPALGGVTDAPLLEDELFTRHDAGRRRPALPRHRQVLTDGNRSTAQIEILARPVKIAASASE